MSLLQVMVLPIFQYGSRSIDKHPILRKIGKLQLRSGNEKEVTMTHFLNNLILLTVTSQVIEAY